MALPGQRVIRPADQPVFLRHERLADDARIRRRGRDQGQADHAQVDSSFGDGQRGGRRGTVVEAKLDAREALAKLRQHGGQQVAGEGVAGTDDELAGDQGACGFEVGASPVHLAEDGLDVPQQKPARIREHGPAALAMKESLAEIGLELRDRLADRRLSLAERARRPREAALTSDCRKSREPGRIERRAPRRQGGGRAISALALTLLDLYCPGSHR